MVYYNYSIVKEINMADDVFVLVTPDFDKGEGFAKEIQGVVLPSRRVIGRDKEYLQTQIKNAQDVWEAEGNSDDIPIEELYSSLARMNMSAYHPGWILPIDEAKELIKNSGGL